MRPILNSLAVFTFTLMAVLAFNTCKENPVDPNENLQPGKRDYVWTVDTLKVPTGTYMTISHMWGSAPNDIWATGDAEESRLGLWHYDGVKWTCNNTPRPMMPRGIWGTSKNNIWVGNINGTFWHFDGVKWAEYSKHTLPGYAELLNQSICGDSPTNIYATGFADNPDGSGHKAIIQRFDGNNWNFINIPTIRSNFAQIKKNSLNQYFINSWDEMNSQTPNKIFLLENNKLNQIYATDKSTSLVQIGGSVYFLLDNKLYKYENKEFVFFKNFIELYFRTVSLGRSEKDIFIWHTNEIKHYNGTDLITLFSTAAHLLSPIIFEKEVFFLAKDFDSGICMSIKGKLIE